jgi:hypothetical protein
MPEKPVKRRLQDCDAALASDDGPIFSTVAKLVAALKRSIPQGTQNAELKNKALDAARGFLRGTKRWQRGSLACGRRATIGFWAGGEITRSFDSFTFHHLK